jgi:hypothetical protein
MKIYECDKCDKIFTQKHHLENHLKRKNPCNKDADKEKKYEIEEEVQITENNNPNTNSKIMKDYLNNCRCVYCNKEFTRKSSVLYHIEHNCKKVKEIEEERNNIFTKLKILEEHNKKLEQENKKLKKYNDNKLRDDIKNDMKQKLLDEVAKIKQELSVLSNNTAVIQNNSNSNSNSNNINSNNNFNSQNIVLNNYNKEDLSNLDEDMIIAIMKRGYQSTVELTRAIHFNPNFPENHNIFIPKINERHGMVFQNYSWKLIDKDDLADDIFENKRDFIIQNLNKFFNKLDQYKQNSLMRFLDNDDYDDEAIINTKNDIKNLLYDNRKMAMDQKKAIERAAKNKPLEILKLKNLKEKSEVKIEEFNNNSDKSYINNHSKFNDSDKDKLQK